MRKYAFAACAALSVLILAVPVLGAPPPKPLPGDLDLSWGTGGIVTSPLASQSGAGGVATRGDETTAVGFSYDGNSAVVAIARYDKRGMLTNTATTPITGLDGGTDAAYMGDKLVVSAFGEARWYVLRYNRDLTLDQSFGTGGIVKVDFQHSGGPSAVRIAGGKIIVVGSFQGGGGGSVIGVARLKGDGSFDRSFGTGGMTTNDVPGLASDVTVVGDRIVVGGSVGGEGSDFQMVAYTQKGALDPRFGTAGKVVTDFGGNDGARAIDSSDGKIVLVGRRDGDFAVAQYDGRGRLDPKFGTGGKAALNLGGFDITADGGYQDDGSIVAVGTRNSDTIDFGVARWTKNGAPDPAFGGGDGFVFTPIGTNFNAQANAMAFGPDHTVVAAGSADDSFALARYQGRKK